MIRILFICHGNICRSPMAEFVMKDLVNKRGISDQFEIASAATTTEEIWGGRGNPVYPPAKEELRKHGIGTSENELGVAAKRARLMNRADYANYDYLIGMDEENRHDMLRIAGGDRENKIHLLCDYTENPRNVADPWYTGNFKATWRDVLDGCTALLYYLDSHR